MVCRSCNNEILNESKTCPICGASTIEENNVVNPKKKGLIDTIFALSISNTIIYILVACVTYGSLFILCSLAHAESGEEGSRLCNSFGINVLLVFISTVVLGLCTFSIIKKRKSGKGVLLETILIGIVDIINVLYVII